MRAHGLLYESSDVVKTWSVVARIQSKEGTDLFAVFLILHRNNACFSYGLVLDQSRFDFGRVYILSSWKRVLVKN